MLYDIPEQNVATLEKRLARLSARTVKAGNSPITFCRTGKFRDIPHATKEGVLVRLIEVEVSTETPAYNGWQFLATICRTEEGNIVRAVPGYEVPTEFRDGEHRCDHCNTVRQRRDTYIVRHTDGRTLRVGSTCVQDFLQHARPNQMTQAARLCFEAFEMATAARYASWLGGTMSETYRTDLETYLNHVAQEVLTSGRFITSKLAAERKWQATSRTAYNSMMNAHDVVITPQAQELASMAREWVLVTYAPALDTDSADFDPRDIVDSLSTVRRDVNDFEHNLLTVARSEAIEPRLMGIAAYIVEAYRRSLPRPEEKTSAYVGTVGQRLRDLDVTFTKVVRREADGCTVMYDKTFCIMQDPAGNVLVWSASGLHDFELNTPYTLTGTVKRHTEYKNRKQTELNRCVIEPKVAIAA